MAMNQVYRLSFFLGAELICEVNFRRKFGSIDAAVRKFGFPLKK
jgi:hypothetical protein